MAKEIKREDSIAKIATDPYIQEVFIARLKAPHEEVKDPEAFVVAKIYANIDDLVQAYEDDENIRIAREAKPEKKIPYLSRTEVINTQQKG